MRKILFSSAALALLAFSPTAVYAQKAVSDAGVEELRRVIDEALTFELEVSKKTGEGLQMSSPPQITNKGSYYEVRFPDVNYAYPDIGNIEVGTIVLNVTHGKTDDEYLASMAVQPTMTFKSAANETVTLNIGKQKFAMAWQASLQFPTRVDAEYGDLKLTVDGKEPFSSTTENFRFITNLQPDKDGMWTGPTEIEVRNIKANFSPSELSGPGEARLERLYSKTDYTMLDLGMRLQSKKKMRDLVKQSGDKPVEDTEAVLNAMLQDGYVMFSDAKSELQFQKFAADVQPLPPKEGQTPEKPRALRLEEFSSFIDMAGLRSDNGKIAARISLKELMGTNLVAPDSAGYLPQNANVELFLENMPMQSLYKAFAALATEGLRASKMAEDAAARGQPHNLPRHHESQVMAAAMALPQMLQNSGASISVRNTFIRAPEISTKLFGDFKAVKGAPRVGAGELTMVIQGLDELLSKLEADQSRQSRRALSGLSFLQVLGQQDTEDGKPIRRYVFKVDEIGKMTLNGTEIGALMGGLPQ
ncbi:MAG TPA: hypothetical protein PLX33_11285 [Alphaproteobacteria bacterium]|nr:hypothetical protein [Alphaproteobacteria bacterium]